MGKRNVRLLGLVVGLVLVLTTAPAFARPAAHHTTPKAPAATITWTHGPASTFAGTRFDGEYYQAQNRVYFLGFRTTGDATDGSVWYYDVAARTYVDTGVDMPVPVSNYGIAALSDTQGVGLYIFGGRDANATIRTTVQVYHPSSNTAAVISSDPWPGTTPSGCVSLPAMGATAIKGKAIVMGGVAFVANGCVADENSSQTWVYNPTAPGGTRWTQGPDLNLARGYVTPAVLNGLVYAIGGDINTAGSLTAQPIVEAWHPGGAAWNDASIADLPEACDESQAFGVTKGPLAGNIVLAGCGQWPNALPDVWQYSATANTWSNAGVIHDNRRNQAGSFVPVNGLPGLYILGGYGEASGFIDPITSSELGIGHASGTQGYRHTIAHGSAGAAVSTS